MNASPVKAIALACSLVFLALVIQLVLGSATWEFMGLSLPWVMMLSIALAVFAGLVTLLLCLIASFLARRGWWPRWLNSRRIVVAGGLMSGVLVAFGIYSTFPRQRYQTLVRVAGDHASQIEVVGFSSFLAHRWLVSFKIAPEQVPEIVSRWGLKEIPPIPLRERLSADVFMGSVDCRVVREAPGAEGTRCFTMTRGGDTSSASWITFVVKESEQRAWFYAGYQN